MVLSSRDEGLRRSVLYTMLTGTLVVASVFEQLHPLIGPRGRTVLIKDVDASAAGTDNSLDKRAL